MTECWSSIEPRDCFHEAVVRLFTAPTVWIEPVGIAGVIVLVLALAILGGRR